MESFLRTLAIAVAISASAFAGQLIDGANVFGPDGARVQNAIAKKQVWIETFVNAPAPVLKEYADSKVRTLTKGGFLVVITTQPRQWRISMNPVGLASSEAVRKAGDEMVAQFRKGKHADGAIALVAALTDPEDNSWIIWVSIGAGTLIIAVSVWALRRNRKREEEAFRKQKAQTFRASNVHEATPPPSANVATPQAAQDCWNRYTPREREVIIERYRDHPGYSPSALSDPLVFWMFMNQMSLSANSGHVHHYYEPPTQSFGSPHRNTSSDDDSRRHSSSSDSSPSSFSSFDSGGSSSSSDFGGGGSSSDSSGAGGSW